MRRLALGMIAIWLLSVFGAEPAVGSNVTLTFDQTALANDNDDPILSFYNGGTTYKGIGPGPDYGVTFVDYNARVFTNTSGLTGTFTPPGIMELYSDTAREGQGISTTMNVAAGFINQVSFDYAAIDSAGELQIYSGVNGTGTLLATLSLPVTSPITGPGTFVADSLSFSGVAQSAVFSGGNKQLGIDDIALSIVPEPSSWILLASGYLLCGAAVSWRRSAPRSS